MTAQRQDHEIFQGDQLVISCAVVDDAGAAKDITGWTFTARLGSSSAPALITGTVSVVSAAGGTFTVTFDAADTEALTPRQSYRYNIKGDDGADKIKIYGWGLIHVNDSLFV